MSNTTARSKQLFGVDCKTAFGSSFDAAASGDRAISMESIRELAKRTVQTNQRWVVESWGFAIYGEV